MTDAKVRIGLKQYEALIWCLSQICNVPDREASEPTDPLYILLAEGFPRDAIMDTATAMFDVLQEDYLMEPLSSLQKAMLRVCVENTTWVTAYIQYGALDGYSEKHCRKLLRDLAASLETLGIEINHIPQD